jgi:hypothetical protein
MVLVALRVALAVAEATITEEGTPGTPSEPPFAVGSGTRMTCVTEVHIICNVADRS